MFSSSTERKQLEIHNYRWWLPRQLDHKSSRPAITMLWLLIKEWRELLPWSRDVSVGPECRKTSRCGARDAQHADVAKSLSVATMKLQQPHHGAFNEWVSVDLIGPCIERSMGMSTLLCYFTKWTEGGAVPSKEAVVAADVVVQG